MDKYRIMQDYVMDISKYGKKDKMNKMVEMFQHITTALIDFRECGFYNVFLTPKKILCSYKDVKFVDVMEFRKCEEALSGLNKMDIEIGYVAPEVFEIHHINIDGWDLNIEQTEIFTIGAMMYWSIMGENLDYINRCTFARRRTKYRLSEEKLRDMLENHSYLERLKKKMFVDYGVVFKDEIESIINIVMNSISRNVDRRYLTLEAVLIKLQNVKVILENK